MKTIRLIGALLNLYKKQSVVVFCTILHFQNDAWDISHIHIKRSDQKLPFFNSGYLFVSESPKVSEVL